MAPKINSEKTIRVMEAREFTSEALAVLGNLEEINGGRLPGRYASLARTALEEANHWLVDSLESGEGEPVK